MTDQEWARHWLIMLSESTGASVEPSDVARIAEYLAGIERGTTTHGQLLAHMGALVTQYTKRGVS
jgi:hypothetical protein